MVEAMNSVAKLGVELNAEERNLFSVGYKNMLGAKRASWSILSVIKSKEEATGDTQHAALAKEYLERVEDELTTKCNEILLTIDDYLLPSSKTGEAAVFYHKMKGDYYRYLAEFISDADREETTSQSLKAYEDATAIAESDLLPTNPIRLGLALNFSMFYYEIMADTERACNMAKQAFEDAAAELDSLDQNSYQDSSLIMRLIMDNLTLWTPDPAEDEDTMEALISISKLGFELTSKDRNLLSDCYKNVLGAKAASLGMLSVIKSNEEALAAKCNKTLKMINDFSVFLYEALADGKRVYDIAVKAYEDAAPEVDYLDGRSFEDITLIMRLIGDNLSLWMSENANAEDTMEALISISKLGFELTSKDRNLLSDCYKNVLGAKAASWGLLSVIKSNEDNANAEEKKAHRGEVQVSNIFDMTNDLLDEVLGRLEIPDILRFGGVSKSLSQLVKEYLLKSHLRQKVFLPSCPFHSVSLRDGNAITAHEIEQVSDRPIHPHLFFPENLIVGSIDGTVLVVELCQSPQKLLLVNPLTKHHREIPHRPSQPHPQNLIEDDEIVNNYAYGLGWAGKPAGLVIVQLYRTFIENMQPCCEMYSLRDACWRKFAPLKGGVHIKQYAGTFLRETNSLYWLATKGKTHVILKLNLDQMLFTELAFSTMVKGVPIQILGRVHSKICALTREYMGSDSVTRCEIWALEEDESRINWSILFTFPENGLFDSQRSGFPKILTFTNDGLLFLLNTEDYETNSTEKHKVAKQFLTIYNISDNSLKELTSPTSLKYISRTQASAYTENTSLPEFFLKGNTGESSAGKVSENELKRACSLAEDVFRMINGKCSGEHVKEGTRK